MVKQIKLVVVADVAGSNALSCWSNDTIILINKSFIHEFVYTTLNALKAERGAHAVLVELADRTAHEARGYYSVHMMRVITVAKNY